MNSTDELINSFFKIKAQKGTLQTSKFFFENKGTLLTLKCLERKKNFTEEQIQIILEKKLY